jgi:hypothetical protein
LHARLDAEATSVSRPERGASNPEIGRWLGCREAGGTLRISANVTADFGNVTDSAGLGVARCRL